MRWLRVHRPDDSRPAQPRSTGVASQRDDVACRGRMTLTSTARCRPSIPSHSSFPQAAVHCGRCRAARGVTHCNCSGRAPSSMFANAAEHADSCVLRGADEHLTVSLLTGEDWVEPSGSGSRCSLPPASVPPAQSAFTHPGRRAL